MGDRIYAAYGGIYIFVAILWLWAVDGVKPTVWIIAGALVALTGMATIMLAPKIHSPLNLSTKEHNIVQFFVSNTKIDSLLLRNMNK